jgi:hypothetical protein
MVTLVNSALNLGVGGTGAANFVLQATDTLSGDVSVGQTLWVQGGGSGLNTTVTAATGFTNAGTIRLESITSAGFNSNLTVYGGMLTNAATGTIQVNAGSGGGRLFTDSLTNQGTLAVAAGTTLTVDLSGGKVLTQAGGA